MNIKLFHEVFNDCDSITFNISDSCNLDCIYCFEKNKSNQKLDYKTAIDYINACYHDPKDENHKFMINFFGGEPLTNWGTIKQIIDYCEDKNYIIRYGITTNLTLITDEILEYVDNYSIGLLVSIDGIKEVHDYNRCNSYDKVKENLSKLQERHCLNLVEARLTLDPSQVSTYYESVLHIYNDLHIDNICPMPVTDKEWTKEQLYEFSNQYKKIIDFYLERVQDLESNRNIYIKSADELLGNVLSPLAVDISMCSIDSKRWVTVGSNGKVYQCHQQPYDDNIDYSIGDIYNGIDIDKMIPELTFVNEEKCNNCISKCICKAGCPMENKRENNNFSSPSNSFCKLITIMQLIAKDKQTQLSKIENFKSRYLNIVRENILLKDYITDIFLNEDFRDPSFKLKVKHIQEKIDNLNDEGNLLPSFETYIKTLFNILFQVMLDKTGYMTMKKALNIATNLSSKSPLLEEEYNK